MACTAFLSDRRAYTCVCCDFHAERNDTALVVEVTEKEERFFLAFMSIVTFWSPSTLAVPKEKGISSTPAAEPLVDVDSRVQLVGQAFEIRAAQSGERAAQQLFQVALDFPADFLFACHFLFCSRHLA